MADQPIGISFIPSAQNQVPGAASAQGAMPGSSGSTDLAQAYKILSLRLPTVVGSSAPVSSSLLNGAGASGLPGGLSPYAAAFLALLKSHLGGDPMALSGMAGSPLSSGGDPGSMGAGSELPGSMPTPRAPVKVIVQDPNKSAPLRDAPSAPSTGPEMPEQQQWSSY